MNKRLGSHRGILVSLAVLVFGVLSGCSEEPKAVKGFVLPEGDIEEGKWFSRLLGAAIVIQLRTLSYQRSKRPQF